MDPDFEKAKDDLFKKADDLRKFAEGLKKNYEHLTSIPIELEKIDAQENDEGIISSARLSDLSVKILFKTESDQKKFFNEHFK